MTEIPTVDLAIIGAGPAGLAAASAAVRTFGEAPSHIPTRAVRTTAGSAAGAKGNSRISATASASGFTAPAAPRVVIIDSTDQPGGQFWRHRAETAITDDGRLHHDWATYRALRADFDAGLSAGLLDYRAATSVWMAKTSAIGFDLCLAPSRGSGRSRDPVLRTKRLIIAAGCFDRQIPIPGWDLPGVMAAGGIQGFAKQNGTLPGRRFLIAGTGPFLLPVAANITQLGGEVAAVLESSRLGCWLPHAHRTAGVPGKTLEGAGYAWTLFRHRIPYRTRTVVTEILGDERVEAVATARIDRLGAVIPGTESIVEGIDAVGLGWGFTPQLELPVALGARTRVDADGSLVAAVDAEQRSNVPGLFLAGEVTGVGGAGLAIAEGRIAGAVAAAEADRRQASVEGSWRRTVARHRAFARSMHLAHPVPAGWPDLLEEDTIVCRCEEVTVGEVAEARATLSATDPRTQKSMTRAGMGWCQGRECGFAVTTLSASRCGRSSESDPGEALRQTMKRPVAQPVTLSTFFDL